jgi:predicted nicotinamide N-methyase
MNKIASSLTVSGSTEILIYTVAGHEWRLTREADLETLWALMNDADNAEDHIPYWAEIWPASLLLADLISERADELRGKHCLDVGCGLGLCALVATEAGARVTAFDSEFPALGFARINARNNGQPQPLWLQMDWRAPSLVPQNFDVIWGGDIVYEKRFFDPLEKLFRSCLAPGGKIWLAQPQREASRQVWEKFASLGWNTRMVMTKRVHDGELRVNVNLWELTLPHQSPGAKRPKGVNHG